MKGKKLLAIVLSLALLVPFAVSKPAQASSYENVMGLWQMDCDEEYVRHPHLIAQDNFIFEVIDQDRHKVAGNIYFSTGEQAGRFWTGEDGLTYLASPRMEIRLRNGKLYNVPMDLYKFNGEAKVSLYTHNGDTTDGGPLRRLQSMDDAIAYPPYNPRQGGDGIMNGTWFFGTGQKNADQKMFIEQDGDYFTGTFNVCHPFRHRWEQGTLSGSVSGNIVTMTVNSTAWDAKGQVKEKRSCTGQLEYNPEKMELEMIGDRKSNPDFYAWTTNKQRMLKYAPFIESPRYRTLKDAYPGAPALSHEGVNQAATPSGSENENGPVQLVEIDEPTPQSSQRPAAAPAPQNGEVQKVALTGGMAQNTTTVHNGTTGVAVEFKPTGAVGYRVYRSETPNDIGISTSDFYLTTTNFVDVNVESNTTYYYTLREVIAEADPINGVEEQPGRILATWTVQTANNIDDGFVPGATRHFIVLKVDDPMMTVDEKEQEVDPGRGTTPINYRNRTMVPIRAVAEAMGGQAGWNGGTREISLAANGAKVQMWVDKKNIKVNGKDEKMDVTPLIKNGRTFTPIRFATENLHCKVDWLNSTKGIVIAWSDRD